MSAESPAASGRAEVTVAAADLKSPEAAQLAQSLAAAASKDILKSYLAALQEQTGASINETLWQKLSGTAATLP